MCVCVSLWYICIYLCVGRVHICLGASLSLSGCLVLVGVCLSREPSLADSWPWVVLSPQPGKKSLLLKMCMSPSNGVVMQPPSTSLARQRILGAERERVVLAYRALKQQQRQQADQLPR